MRNKKKHLLFILIIVLLGIAVYLLNPEINAKVWQFALLTLPRPLPDEVAGVYPHPGSRITVSQFEEIGAVCLETYGDLFGIYSENFDLQQLGRIHLLINEEPINHWFNRNFERTGSLKGPWNRICWRLNFQLAPGDYLAELKIEGVDSELMYSWAFHITND